MCKNLRVLAVDNYTGVFVGEQIKSISEFDNSIKFKRFSINGRASSLNYFRAIFRLHKLLQEEEYDIIHAHYGLSCIVARMQCKTPVICTFHGADVQYILWQSVLSRIVSFFIPTSIAVNQNIAKKLHSQKTYVIPCGVDMKFFEPFDKYKARKKLGLNLKKKYVLFPSSPDTQKKNYPLFLRVLKELKKSMDVAQLYLKGLSREKVRDYLNATDVVLITSFSEGSNTVMKEALFCNTPVVSVNVGDAEEILPRFDERLLTSYNVKEIAEKVKWAISENKKWNFRESISFFDSNNIAKKLVKIYRELER